MTIKALVFDAYGTLFDVQSVAGVTDRAFPGHGAAITQIWRLKQLEYTWLRALMDRYEDFWTVTRDSLDFTCGRSASRRRRISFGRLPRPMTRSPSTRRRGRRWKGSPRTASPSSRTAARRC